MLIKYKREKGTKWKRYARKYPIIVNMYVYM